LIATGAVKRHITGEQHDPHNRSPELALDRIAAGEKLLEGQEFGADSAAVMFVSSTRRASLRFETPSRR